MPGQDSSGRGFFADAVDPAGSTADIRGDDAGEDLPIGDVEPWTGKHYSVSKAMHVAEPLTFLAQPPSSGWRRAVFTLSRGRFNPGESEAERHLRDLTDRICRPMPDRFVIGVLSGKGGVGKTVLAACIGGIFRQFRPENVVAVDATPEFGTLATRIDPNSPDGYTELLERLDIQGYTDVRRYLGHNSNGLDVLAGNQAFDQLRALSSVKFRETILRLGRTHHILIVDISDCLDHPVFPEVLNLCDSLVFVSGLGPDTSLPVAHSIDLLRSMNYHGLLSRSVVALNDNRGQFDQDVYRRLVAAFDECELPTRFIPYDKHLASGGVIDVRNSLQPKTHLRLVEMVGFLTDQYPKKPRKLAC